jgi:hypothetical protein
MLLQLFFLLQESAAKHEAAHQASRGNSGASSPSAASASKAAVRHRDLRKASDLDNVHCRLLSSSFASFCSLLSVYIYIYIFS